MIEMILITYLIVGVGGYSAGAFDDNATTDSVTVIEQMNIEAEMQAFDEGDDNA